MAIAITHPFVSAKTDGADGTLVQPSDWNEGHTITMAAGKIMGRDTSGAGAVQELPLAFATTYDVTLPLTTGSMIGAKGTTAQRSATPATGMIRYNTTTGGFEGYDSSASWQGLMTTAAVTAAITAAVSAATPTGSIRACLKLTADTGWVRLNGLTIGSATSGGTERANADCETLFTYLWTNLTDTTAPLLTSAGAASTRGASAAVDWAANKRVTLPSSRDRVLVGMATMGTADAALISLFDTTIMGNTGGDEAHTHTATADTAPGVWGISGGGPAASSHTHVITVDNGKAIPPALVVCLQIKL